MNIRESFEVAGNALSISFKDQHPLLDANGNGIGNEVADYDLIGNLHIGNGTDVQGDVPVIESVSEPQHISGINTTDIKAFQVTDKDGIARVWAVIRPPDYGQGATDNPVTGLPSVDLLPAGDGKYEASYDRFDQSGTYQIAIYAKDGIGNTAVPKLTTVSVTTPLKRKAVIVVGCSHGN